MEPLFVQGMVCGKESGSSSKSGNFQPHFSSVNMELFHLTFYDSLTSMQFSEIIRIHDILQAIDSHALMHLRISKSVV